MFFRSDINALRAIAFAAVLLYHFRVPGFSGGFVGVDIFLVISGYLMMSIISRQVDAQKFNLIEFYSRRVGRIITPMIPVAISVCVIGYLILPPSALEQLAKHTIGMFTFTSNIMFWRESGYFNDANSYNFLLHSWSLSLEVQFYLIFPLIFFVLRLCGGKTSRTILPLTVLIIGLFVACIIASQLKPIPSFYLLPTRLWQFLLGALVYELMRTPSDIIGRRILGSIGLLLIAASIALIDNSVLWPGWLAGLPSLGAALVIFSNLPLKRLYDATIVSCLGKVSYSGYLWHWPIAVTLTTFGKIDDPIWQMAGLIGTLVLAFLSWRLVEQGLGQWLQTQPISSRTTGIVAFIAIASVFPVIALNGNGMPDRFAKDVNQFFQSAEDRPTQRLCNDRVRHSCIIGDPSPDNLPSLSGVGAMVVGDSHAAMISQIVADALPVQKSRVLAFTLPACPTIRGIRVELDFRGRCADSIDRFFSLHEMDPSIPVVVANRYAFYLEGFNETVRGARPNYSPSQSTFTWSREYVDAMSQAYFQTLCTVAQNGRVVLIYPFPEFTTPVSPRISLEMAVTGDYVDETLSVADYQMRNAGVFPLLDRLVHECGARPVDPLLALCNGNECLGTRNRSILFTDSNHLTSSGTEIVAEAIQDAISEIASSVSPQDSQ